MTYLVSTIGIHGSFLEVEASCEGEMLDRVRYAMASEFIASVSVERV